MNSITLSGNVGKDPESRALNNGESVVTVNIADTYGSKDNRKTQWFRCEFWGKRGEAIMKYVKKGSKLIIVGQLKQDTYTDKNGVERTSMSINVSDFDFGSKSSDSSEATQNSSGYPVATNPASAPSTTIPAGQDAESDLPF
jgi:single-strand DNA-binding protein